MALATHHLQGSCRTCALRLSSWNSGNTFQHFVSEVYTFGQKDKFSSMKCKSFLRIGVSPVLQPNRKSLKISAFKNNSQNSSGGRAGGSKSLENSEKLSHVPQESEETSIESTSSQNVPITYHKTTNYHVIQDMLKSWITLLRTPVSNKMMDGTLEGTSFPETLEMQKPIQKKENGDVLKAVWCQFQSSDATIKILILAFIPLYLAVNLAYGAEVSKELTPLWVLGPCLVALYMKMLGSICAAYVFCFKQTVNVVKKFATYYLLAYNYIACGKLKADIRARILLPMVDFKNAEYNKLAKGKVKDFQLFMVEGYLDFVELIWPCYCRTLRFLKRTRFI